jgi:hypothetical protein
MFSREVRIGACRCRNGAFLPGDPFVGNSLLQRGTHYELSTHHGLLLWGGRCAAKCCTDLCSESHLRPQPLVDIDVIAVAAQ